MNGFWNQLIFDNPVKKYLYVFIAIAISLLIKRLFSRFIAGQLFRGAKAIDKGLDKNAFVKLMLAPLEIFLIAFVSVAAIDKLQYPSVLEFEIYEVPFRSIVHGIAKTILIVVFIWLILRTIDFVALLLKQKAAATGDLRDHQLVVFFRDFLKIIIGIIGILMVLGMAFGFEVSKLWTGLGLAGAALALSLKESIENLIASFIIFFDKPFTTGDILKVNNITGTVERIGLRSTRIRTDLKTYVTVPNKQMVDSIVDNLSLRTYRKAELRLQFDSSTSAGTLDQLIAGLLAILNKDRVENSSAFLNDITGSAYLVNVDYFTSPVTQEEFNAIRQQINLDTLRLMERLGISIAGASTDIILRAAPSIPAENS